MNIQESANKTYSAVELLDFPIGTKFKISGSGNLVEVGTVDKIKGIFTVNNKGFCWDKEKCIPFNELWLSTEFIKIQQPVSFTEILGSKGKVRVEHKLVEKCLIEDIRGIGWEKSFKRGEFIPFNFLMHIISFSLGWSELRTVIQEGKWYLEDEIDE